MANVLQTHVTEGGIGESFPSGYTAPTVTHTFTAAAVEMRQRTFTVPSSGNVDADASTGLGNFVTALEAQVTTFLGNGAGNAGIDTTTNTVKTLVTIKSMERQAKEDSESSFETGGDEIDFGVIIKYEVTA